MNKNLVLLLFVMLSISCKEKVKTLDFKSSIKFSDEDFKKTVRLESQILHEIPDSLMFNAKIFVDKNYLILNEIKSDKFMHIIALPQEKYLGRYGDVGTGPGEVLVPWEFTKSESGLLRIMDPQQKKIVEFSMDSLLNGSGIYNKEYMLPSSAFSRNACILNGNIYFLNGNNIEHRLFEANINGDNIKGYGLLPEKESGIKNFQHVLQICAASLAQQKNFIVIGHRYIPLIQIFNSNDKKWLSIVGPENYMPKFKNYQIKIQYNDIKIKDNYIYALYNGNETRNEHSSIIYVFDYQGIPIKKIILNQGIISFDIYMDEIIYGINMENKSKIIKFKI